MFNSFVSDLKKDLSSVIKGNISIHVKGNVLIVDIVNLSSYFRHTVEIPQDKMVTHFYEEIIVNEIVTKYAKFICENYFIIDFCK